MKQNVIWLKSFCLSALVLLASAGTGWCNWAFWNAEFDTASTPFTQYSGGYTYTGGWAEKIFEAGWPQVGNVDPYGYIFYGATLNLGTSGYPLPFNIEAHFDLPEGVSTGIDLSPLHIDVTAHRIIRFRFFDAGGNIVNDDIWTDVTPTPTTFSALGCPASVYTADPIALRYAFTNDSPPQVIFSAITDAGWGWTSAPQTLIESPWAKIRLDMSAFGTTYPTGIPKAATAVDASASPTIRVDYIRAAAGLGADVPPPPAPPVNTVGHWTLY